MTAARQERKSRRLGGLGGCSGGDRGGWLRPCCPTAIGAATTELVVVNRYTGLAIDGFDPVAYFVDAAPKTGRAELELQFAGATWRFHNEGNRAAFAADPDVYMPRFGGYDPIAVARGAATPGHPRLWLIAEKRLYLFYSAAARAAFVENPDRAIDAAERHWPEVLRTLRAVIGARRRRRRRFIPSPAHLERPNRLNVRLSCLTSGDPIHVRSARPRRPRSRRAAVLAGLPRSDQPGRRDHERPRGDGGGQGRRNLQIRHGSDQEERQDGVGQAAVLPAGLRRRRLGRGPDRHRRRRKGDARSDGGRQDQARLESAARAAGQEPGQAPAQHDAARRPGDPARRPAHRRSGRRGRDHRFPGYRRPAPTPRCRRRSRRCLAGQPADHAVDAHAIQPFYTGLLAKNCGLTVAMASEGDAVVVTAR